MADVPDAFNHLKQLTDIGDIVGIKGTIRRTEKGELSGLCQPLYHPNLSRCCPYQTSGMV
jgi:lysyl-tRNA synthetase class II